jgi:HEPN domain-containing protein
MSDPGSRPVETPAEWLRFAEENLAVARRELGYEQPAHHTICFLCHTAAEKYLKGYLISRGWTLKKTHDLLELLELCAEYDPAFGSIVTDGSILNEYSVSGRYPADIAFETFDADNALEAVQATEHIRDFIAARMALTKKS